MRTIEVIVEKDGTVTIDVDGTTGDTCDIHTGALLQALDAEVISDVKKPEYYAQESVKTNY